MGYAITYTGKLVCCSSPPLVLKGLAAKCFFPAHSLTHDSFARKAVSSHSSHHPQEVILAQFSLFALNPIHFTSLGFKVMTGY